MTTWVSDSLADAVPGASLEHLDGVPWDEAPLPRRWHRCRPQTRGVSPYGLGETIYRCACGGKTDDVGIVRGWWDHRNERRRVELLYRLVPSARPPRRGEPRP